MWGFFENKSTFIPKDAKQLELLLKIYPEWKETDINKPCIDDIEPALELLEKINIIPNYKYGTFQDILEADKCLSRSLNNDLYTENHFAELKLKVNILKENLNK